VIIIPNLGTYHKIRHLLQDNTYMLLKHKHYWANFSSHRNIKAAENSFFLNQSKIHENEKTQKVCINYTNNEHNYRNELHEIKSSYWRKVREDNKMRIVD
jgi:uncharacterized membrane protein